MKKRLLPKIILLVIIIMVLFTSKTMAAENLGATVMNFGDVKQSDWFYDSVKYVYENGLMTGYNTKEFAPKKNLTREQLICILWRMEGSPKVSNYTNGFSDVKTGQWYTDAINWGAKNKIINGYGNSKLFGIGDNILRQDFALMLTNYATYKGYYELPMVQLDSFKDKSSVSSYAQRAVRWAVEDGIIQGNTNSDGSKSISPLSNATRCEAAAMLQRFHSKNKDRTIKNGVYEIRSGVNNQYILDVLDGSKSNGANIQLLQDASADKQRFMVSYEGYGYYTIVAFHSKKAIGCKKSTTDTNVFQYDLNNTDTERWMIKSVGNGYYNIISKQTNLYLESKGSQVANNTNIQTGSKNNSANQKFKFEFIEDIIKDEKGSKTIEDGIYEIHLSSNTKYTLDVYKVSQLNKANVQLWVDSDVDEQRFKITYQGDGYYTIMALHSKKLVEVTTGQRVTGVNVQQYESNGSDDQKWIIKKISNGKYSFISKASGLYMEAASSSIQNGTNIQVGRYSDSDLQRFSLNLVANVVSMDTNKYPGYQEKINALAKEHPNWKFELLYTGLKYSNVIAGETAVHSRNLVPTDYEGEWICPTCGKKLYDSGWYCASSKAVAYYMDPRNFLDETYIFQFVDVNSFNSSISLSAIQDQVDGTFLEDYASDIRNACQRTGVNPFYIISRLIQEQGRKGTRIGTGMDGGDGKTYYNPFNIGASGNGSSAIYANALAKAKANGWDTMEKAIEGGIGFCKKNWLDNYQNTLYQNKFDIDDRNGTALYNHQYMQNLMAACSEGKLLQGMYRNTDLLDSKITFIIPVYEEMTKDSYPIPKSDSETYPMDIESTAGDLRIREEPNTDCEILRIVPNKGTKLLSLQRGINSNWQKVITKDGLIGYVSGSYVKQINDITTCNYNAIVKTNDGDGCNIRIGPSTRVSKITALADNTQVTVIDDSTYKGIDGYDWSRIIVKSTGIQAFIPSRYLSKN